MNQKTKPKAKAKPQKNKRFKINLKEIQPIQLKCWVGFLLKDKNVYFNSSQFNNPCKR